MTVTWCYFWLSDGYLYWLSIINGKKGHVKVNEVFPNTPDFPHIYTVYSPHHCVMCVCVIAPHPVSLMRAAKGCL